MKRLLIGLCVGAYLGLGVPTVLIAQDISYDEGALRIEGHRGDMRIVRGVQGTVLASISGFRTPDVVKLVSPSEKAMFEARSFAHDYGPGSWLTAFGIAAFGAGIGTSRIHDLNSSVPIGLTIGGAALMVYGGGRLQHAYNALSRSIWWYNRDLKK
jgi:hypothetical protein